MVFHVILLATKTKKCNVSFISAVSPARTKTRPVRHLVFLSFFFVFFCSWWELKSEQVDVSARQHLLIRTVEVTDPLLARQTPGWHISGTTIWIFYPWKQSKSNRENFLLSSPIKRACVHFLNVRVWSGNLVLRESWLSVGLDAARIDAMIISATQNLKMESFVWSWCIFCR